MNAKTNNTTTTNTQHTTTTTKQLFFGTILAISGAIISGGLIGEWWAYATLIPAGAITGWKWAERI